MKTNIEELRRRVEEALEAGQWMDGHAGYERNYALITVKKWLDELFPKEGE